MQKFSDALATALRTRGVSRRQLATVLGLQPTTLTTWISTNRFPSEQALRIARELGLADDAGDLEDHYEIEFTQIHPATHISVLEDHVRSGPRERERRLREVAQATQPAMDLASLLDAMEAGSVYAYFSLDRLPDELTPATWPSLAGPFIAAMQRGLTCIYLYPDEIALSRLARAGVSGVQHPSIWEARIALLRDEVSAAIPDGPLGQRIFAVEARNLAFSSPSQAYLLTRASAAAPLRGRTLLASMGGILNVPLAPAAESDLAHMLMREAACDRQLRALLRVPSQATDSRSDRSPLCA